MPPPVKGRLGNDAQHNDPKLPPEVTKYPLGGKFAPGLGATTIDRQTDTDIANQVSKVKAEFINISTVHLRGCPTLWDGCPGHRRVWARVPGLHATDAISCPPSQCDN